MTNITTDINNLNISDHGTHEGISSSVDGTKNGNTIPSPGITVNNHDNMSSSTSTPENMFTSNPTSTYMHGNIFSSQQIGTLHNSPSIHHPIPFSEQSNFSFALSRQ